MNNTPEIISIVGPTACGKTRRAVQLARSIGGEIISGDSRQVYRGMDIGTGKDLSEYGDIRYHLVDIEDAGMKYNLHRFLRDFRNSFDGIRERGAMPILCGGTGMYVEAALAGIVMPEVARNEQLRSQLAGKSLEELTEILGAMKSLHNSTDVDTRDRALRAIEIQHYYSLHPEEALAADRESAGRLNSLIIGLDIPREERRARISSRLRSRLDEGMVEEVRSLIASGVHPDSLIYYGLEYKYVTMHILGQLSLDEMTRQLEIAIHQFAKRQMTWFRGMERRGFRIHWLPYDLSESDFISEVMAALRKPL